MSPRRTRPPRRLAGGPALDDDEARLASGFDSIEFDARGDEWIVRRLTGSSSTKVYRCPGCDQEIRPATPHIVAWPREYVDRRRHWHTPCWQARERRSAR